MLLAIDTATRMASLALHDGGRVRSEVTWEINDHHTVELTPRIMWMMSQAEVSESELSALAVSIGPGSFTGLRVGLAIAKGLALAIAIPIVGVPTLDIVAYAQTVTKGPLLAVLQVGRGKLATLPYRRVRGAWRAQGELQVVALDQIGEDWDSPVWLCGELDATARAALSRRLGKQVKLIEPARSLRRAAFLAELGWRRVNSGHVDDLDSLAPIYIPTAGVGST